MAASKSGAGAHGRAGAHGQSNAHAHASARMRVDAFGQAAGRTGASHGQSGAARPAGMRGGESAQDQPIAHIWRAASYARLSVDDGEAGQSGSITSQQRIIEDWAAQRDDVEIVDRFVDDGWSGSNFERPAFKRMMEAADAGAIDCILVKDLSRLGRNYLETGRLLERVFPAKGVRLVAVNDGYDGLDVWGAGFLGNQGALDTALLVPFKNLINDFYCATTSAKVKAALSVRRREGLFVGARAPYGYRKNDGNRNVLEIDPEAAGVVARMFEMRAQGAAFAEIARRLNDEGVPSPAARGGSSEQDGTVERGGTVGQDGAPEQGGAPESSARGWSASYIRRILANRTYTGMLVQGRTFKPSFRQRERLVYPPGLWTYSEGACPAIVDEELFDLVQRLGESALCVKGRSSSNPLRGMVYCGRCGARLSMHSSSRDGRRYSYYRCTGGCRLSVRVDRVLRAVEGELGSMERAYLLKREVRVNVGEESEVFVLAARDARGRR